MCAIVGAELADKLPFQCPYKVPEELQPSSTGKEGGGLTSVLFEDGTLNEATRDVYAQYRAALALVPCDGQAVSVFTESEIERNFSAVSVIFVYDKPVESLKKWLT